MADDWYTPKKIFDALGVEFDIDVCSPAGGTGLVPAKKFYSIEDDCLTQDWKGFVWLNPPFSNPKPFVEKFIEHGNGIALVAITKSKWFNYLWEKADSAMIIAERPTFVRPNGGATQLFQNVMLMGMGDKATKAMIASNLGKVR